MNRLSNPLWLVLVILTVVFAGCQPAPPTPTSTSSGQSKPGSSQVTQTQITAPLPDSAFKATLKPVDAPTQMKAGESVPVQVTITNNSTNPWPSNGDASGKFAITLRNRWLMPDGKKVVNDIDGGTSLPRDVRPGDTLTMTIKVTAPKQRGDYVLEFDMVQEQVAFFREKGSQPTQLKVTVQ